MIANRILFAGMHESGKTTFIAALWDYINSDKVGRKLTLNTLANSENQHLEKIRSEWLQCKKVSRTNLTASETVRMDVTRSANSNNLILEIPDISGEIFNEHFKLREWEVDYEELINHLGGILLFINPIDNRNRTNYIADAISIETEITFGLDEEIVKMDSNVLNRENTEINDFAKWSEKHTSNQVKLVETLQLIANRLTIDSPIRISVIVSLWDLIENNGSLTPDDWMRLNMPLLHQYLICNSDIFRIQVYGVSAQGGDYKNNDERMSLLALDPHDRPQVKQNNTFINDITAPIIWLTEN